MLRHTDLCSGIGGFSLGFQWAGLSEPVLFCDTDAWCRKVLAKHWPDVPIAEDVKELANDPNGLVPDCDILSCGYPCQPFSQAGVRRGEEDDRHIWPEIFTIIQAKRPTWIVCENVFGHISLGLDTVLSDLEDKAGYAVQTFCIGAVSVDAPHRRLRVWIVGHTTDNGRNRGAEQTRRKGQTHQSDQPGLSVRGEVSGPSENVADTDSKPSKVRGQHQTDATESLCRGSDARGSRGNDRWEFGASPNEEDVADTDSQRGRLRHTQRQDAEDAGQSPRGQEHGGWDFEPPVGRVAHGIPRRVDRLKGLGNAIVPQIAMRIGQTIKAVNSCNTE